MENVYIRTQLKRTILPNPKIKQAVRISSQSGKSFFYNALSRLLHIILTKISSDLIPFSVYYPSCSNVIGDQY